MACSGRFISVGLCAQTKGSVAGAASPPELRVGGEIGALCADGGASNLASTRPAPPRGRRRHRDLGDEVRELDGGDEVRELDSGRREV